MRHLGEWRVLENSNIQPLHSSEILSHLPTSARAPHVPPSIHFSAIGWQQFDLDFNSYSICAIRFVIEDKGKAHSPTKRFTLNIL